MLLRDSRGQLPQEVLGKFQTPILIVFVGGIDSLVLFLFWICLENARDTSVAVVSSPNSEKEVPGIATYSTQFDLFKFQYICTPLLYWVLVGTSTSS